MALLEVQDLKLHYRTDRGAVRAVDGATFSVEEGQALGVVGESGSGKSSLALALLRVLPRNVQLYEGSVRMEGVDVMSPPLRGVPPDLPVEEDVHGLPGRHARPEPRPAGGPPGGRASSH